ncbi:MAG: FAD-dependent oxidoreductase [Pseudomonadota bacterium]
MTSGTGSVVVTGGGIVGLACAHYLTSAGFAVTVIDRSGIGQGCSHGNCGYVCPSHVLPLTEPGAWLDGIRSLFRPESAFRIKPQLRLDIYRWLFEFARRCTHDRMLEAGHRLQPLLESSMAEYKKLFDSTALAGEWKEHGLLYVFETDAGFAGFERTDALLTNTYGLAARRIEGDELPEFDAALKDGLAGAYFYDGDASVRSDRLIREWRSELTNSGVEFIENCRLERVSKSAGRIEALQTVKGELTADYYVFAAGAWSSELAAELDCRIPVEPGKGYSLTIRKPDCCPAHPMLFPEHRVGVTPFDESYRIGSMMEFVGFDSSIPERRITQLKDSARPYLKTPVDGGIEETWYGWRPMTWDSLPIIGRVPRLGNGLLATGHNMLGLTLAPATGRLIAELVCERATHIAVDAFSPARF